MSDPLFPDVVALSLDARRRIADVCSRFDQVWTAGSNPRIEDHLPPDWPPGERRELLRALLEVEVYYRLGAGEALHPREYLRRFPAEADVILEVLRSPTAPTVPVPSTQPPVAGETPGTTGGPWPSVPGYEMLGELGRGGMGIVYLARQAALNRFVALKMILSGDRAGPQDLARFRREAESVARLRHPNIVQIFEVGEHDGLPYFSLEFCPGGSLAARLRNGPLQPRAAARVVEQLAEAMQAAHEQKVIHRDLKPSNVLLDDGPEVPLSDCPVKVSDFGLAKQLDVTGHTDPGAVLGTPSYMAPEQAAGKGQEVGPAADVYALGAVLYACLTGGPPFHGATNFDILMQVVGDEPVPPSQLNRLCPRDLETICLKCLQKRPGERYATARQLAEDLRRYRDGKPILARPAGRLERLVKWARRSPAQAVAVATAAAFVLALFGALAGQVRLLTRRLEEGRRQDELLARFTDLYSLAETRAAEARPADADAWSAVERDVGAALELIKAEPAFRDFPLREPAGRLQAHAREQLADARERAERQARLARLKAHCGDAVFFGTLSSGLELHDNLERTRRAAADGLALFEVTADNDGPPAAADRFYQPEEIRLITDCCHELLLLDAEALARRGAGEEPGAWQGRLRQALRLLDRADRLRPGVRTHAVLARRAEYLNELGEAGAARQARQAADETAPSLAGDYFFLGMERHARDEFREAIEPLANALRLQPGHYGAEYLLAVCRLREGQLQDAKVGLSRCLEQRPDFLWPRLLRGYAEMELLEFEAARADFDAVLAKPPDATASYVALVDRGVLATRRNLCDEAVADLRRAIDLRPDDVAAYVNLALTHRQRAAVFPAQVGQGLLAPRGAYALLALEAHRRRALAEGVAVLDEAIRRRPLVARLYHERGRLHLLRDVLAPAQADFTRAILLAANAGAASTLPDDLIELGRLLQRAGQYDEAIEAYQGVLTIRPNHAEVHRLMAESLLAKRRYPEAGAALDRYLATLPLAAGQPPTPAQAREVAKALKARGLIHVELMDFRAAIDSYTQGLKLTRDPETLAYRGWAYLMLGAAPVALLDFEEALKLQPGFADALLGRAEARVKQGKVREALADAEEGLRRGPATPRLLYLAARVYSQAEARLSDPATATRSSLDRAADHERRAVELLRAALALVPAGKRADFWHDNVERDSALNPIRSHQTMRALEAQFARQGRGMSPSPSPTADGSTSPRRPFP